MKKLPRNLLWKTLLILACFVSCKKDRVTFHTPGTGMPETRKFGDRSLIINKIRLWIDFKARESQQKSAVAALLRENLDLDNLDIGGINDSSMIAVVPLRSGFHLPGNGPAVGYLVAAFDKNLEVGSCHLVGFSPAKNAGGQPSAAVFAEMRRSGKAISGKFLFLNLAGKFVCSLEYEGNRLVRKTSKRLGKEEPAMAARECTTWWLVHTDVYVDHVEREWELLGTFCDLDEFDMGGGGGGSAAPEDPCVSVAEDQFDKEVNGASVSSIPVVSNISYLDPVTKRKDPVWVILNGFGPWHLESQEIGVIKLVDASSSIWHWVSLKHGAISMVGSTLPGASVTHSQGVGTPSVYTLYAGMSLNYTVTYHFVCNCPNFPLLGWIPPVTKKYTSTCIWDSKPV